MYKLFLNVIAMFGALLLPVSYASTNTTHNITAHKDAKTYVIRVTSDDIRNPRVKINGTILQSTDNQDANLIDVNTVTPWEMTLSADYIRYIIKTDLKNPRLKLEIYQKGDTVGASGLGHTFDGSETVYDMTYGIFILN